LEVIHNMLIKSVSPASSSFPLASLKGYFAGRGKDTDLDLADLADMKLRYIILNLLYVKNFGVSPFDVRYHRNEPQIDHIYPKSKLKMPVADVNNIGNYRFIGANENLRKRAEDASTYFSRLKSDGVNIKGHLLLDEFADNPSLMTIANYQRFRDERIQKVFDICASVVNR
jgi:hypothetical protein